MVSPALLNEITTFLSTHWQTAVTVEPVAELNRHYMVVRCRVTGHHADLPLNVIVNQ